MAVGRLIKDVWIMIATTGVVFVCVLAALPLLLFSRRQT